MKKGCANAAINLYSFHCMPVIDVQKNEEKQRVFEWVTAFFHEKNDGKKDANIDIQTYLLFGNQVQSFPAINQNASMLSGG